MPAGIQLLQALATGFGGPCPPVGHGFTHTFYSLRIKTDNLGLDATANPELVG
jgi:phosphatidylethanolamine-binding protein (PEBP) family uncharacterized protein